MIGAQPSLFVEPHPAAKDRSVMAAHNPRQLKLEISELQNVASQRNQWRVFNRSRDRAHGPHSLLSIILGVLVLYLRFESCADSFSVPFQREMGWLPSFRGKHSESADVRQG